MLERNTAVFPFLMKWWSLWRISLISTEFVVLERENMIFLQGNWYYMDVEWWDGDETNCGFEVYNDSCQRNAR